MKLIGYELKKLCNSRYVPIILILLLISSGVLAYIDADQCAESSPDNEMMEMIYSDYQSSPDEFFEYMNEVKAFEEECNQLFTDAIMSGNVDGFEMPEKSWKYTGGSYTKELKLMESIIKAHKDNTEYRKVIEDFIAQNEKRLRGYDADNMSPDDFLYRYTEYTIEVYRDYLENAQAPEFEYHRGWRDYFLHEDGNILPFMAIAVFVCAIFLSDKSCGFYFVMSAYKKGRSKTVGAKIWLAVLLSMIIALLFSLLSFLIFAGRLGLSSPYNTLQSIAEFKYVPHNITVIGYFGLILLIRALTAVLFALLICSICSVFASFAASYLSVAGLVGGSLFIYLYDALNNTDFLKVNNLFSLYSANGLFVRVRAYSFFGIVADNLILLPIILTLITAAMIAVIFLFYHKKSTVSTWKFKGLIKIIDKIRTRIRKIAKPRFGMKLASYEAYKIFASFWVFALLVICIFGSIYTSSQHYHKDPSYFEAAYNTYMDRLSGADSVEKQEYLQSERLRINGILTTKEEMQLKYAQGEISFQEYSDYMEEYYNTEVLNTVFMQIENRHRQITEHKSLYGKDIWYIHGFGYSIYFDSSLNLWLYALILIIFSSVFTREHQSNNKGGSFHAVMSCTKKGRAPSFWCKYALSFIVTTAIFAVFEGMELYFLERSFGLPELDAPISSVDRFYNLATDITIGEYLIIGIAVRYIGTIGLLLITLSMSELAKKILPTLSFTTLITLIPHGGVLLGANILSYIDLALVMDSHSLLEFSASVHHKVHLYFILIAAWMIISGALTVMSYRSFNKTSN